MNEDKNPLPRPLSRKRERGAWPRPWDAVYLFRHSRAGGNPVIQNTGPRLHGGDGNLG